MSAGRLVAGLALIVVGILFLLGQIGLVEAGRLIGEWWPAILILLGVVQLVAAPRAWIGPGLLIVIGAILLTATLGILAVDVWSLAWPLALIGIGAWLILSRLLAPGPAGTADETIDSFIIFSGLETKSHSRNFKGGNLTAMFGGIELDLSQAQLAPEGARLTMTAILGGVELKVPGTWRVTMQGVPILGGFENSTSPEEPLGDDAPTLTINGMALLGGIEVKN